MYRPLGITDEDAQQRLARGLQDMSFEIQEVLACERFLYPKRADLGRCSSGWFDRVDACQGRDGIYFVGEALAGQGIPTISQHVQRFAVRHFAGEELSS